MLKIIQGIYNSWVGKWLFVVLENIPLKYLVHDNVHLTQINSAIYQLVFLLVFS